MKQKTYAVLGVTLLAVLAVGLLATYSAPMALADSTRQRGHGQAWWTEGLTEQQVDEIRQKIWDIRARASKEGWSDEQTRTAIHELLVQYGIDQQGVNFVDANGDGICDHLDANQARGHGQGRWQCMNATECSRT